MKSFSTTEELYQSYFGKSIIDFKDVPNSGSSGKETFTGKCFYLTDGAKQCMMEDFGLLFTYSTVVALLSKFSGTVGRISLVRKNEELIMVIDNGANEVVMASSISPNMLNFDYQLIAVKREDGYWSFMLPSEF